jgi:signal transduction histidine kinase
VAEIIDEALSYVEYQNVFDDVRVAKQYSPNVYVFGDRSRYMQVFLNVITNAADAMDGRGTLTIATETAGMLTALVKITDTGPGVPAEIESKLFDPFFTTKDPGKGTGLGLAIAYKIVQESAGRLWFSSTPQGTTFFVMLPSVKDHLRESTRVAGRR